MTGTIIAMRLHEIDRLIKERRFELALMLTERLEDWLASVPSDDAGAARPIRDLVHAARECTQALVCLRDLQVH